MATREYEIVFVVTAENIEQPRMLAQKLWNKWARWYKNDTFEGMPKIESRMVRKSTLTERATYGEEETE